MPLKPYQILQNDPDLMRGYMDRVPHSRALHMQVWEVGYGTATVMLPYAPHLAADATGRVHDGAITSLFDSLFGIAVYVALDEPLMYSTLDLRVEVAEPAPAGKDLYARGECYRVTREVAYTRAIAYWEHPNRPFASANGTFFFTRQRQPMHPLEGYGP